jgi:phosphopantothenoylcysteine decarboxylase / phosphopantothenate---cysteine ligase
MLQGKKILLGITGSIAAYKAANLIRLLIKQGAEVQVIMTQAATQFITPLTISTLCKNKVYTHLFEDGTWENHVMLGRWADVMLIAPASCNNIAKMANGICDNMLQAVYLSATCKVMLAPAMDEDMWIHPSTKNNINKLTSFGNVIIPVNNGELASGLIGPGRMAEPEEIVNFLQNHFSQSQQLKGKSVLITAGPTYEQIDPVRFIGNNSSGKMGIALAQACQQRGAIVHLVLGPTSELSPASVQVTHVRSAAQMYDACVQNFTSVDIAIMSAAVADYTPALVANEKIKKKEDSFSIELAKTKDILKELGHSKKPHQTVVGFALETNNERENALGKLQSKNADFIVLNSLQDEGAGFSGETNKITIFDKQKKEYKFTTKSKREVAEDILNTILNKNEK